MILKPSDIDRFQNQLAPKNSNGCIEWTGSTWQGYGRMGIGKKNEPTHRVAWTIANGEITSKECVLHKCDNRKCNNVEHLFIGSRRDNALDMTRKRRNGDNKGNKNPSAKLDGDKVTLIHWCIRNKKSSVDSLSKIFRVSKSTIYLIKRGRAWKHLGLGMIGKRYMKMEGNNNHQSKVTGDRNKLIGLIKKGDITHEEIGKKYGVSKGTVKRIKYNL